MEATGQLPAGQGGCPAGENLEEAALGSSFYSAHSVSMRACTHTHTHTHTHMDAHMPVHAQICAHANAHMPV